LAASSHVAAADKGSFVVGEWAGGAHSDPHGFFRDCSAEKFFHEPKSSWKGLMIAMDRDHNVGLLVYGEKSAQWAMSVDSVGVQVDGYVLGRKHAEKIDSTILIKVGKAAPFLAAIARGSVLSVDIGNEVLKYKLSDIEPIFLNLNKCVASAVPADTVRASRKNQSAGEAADWQPGPNDVPVVEGADEGFCLQHPALAFYHPTLDRKPAKEERNALIQDSQRMAACTPTWKSHCESQIDNSWPGLNQLCEWNARSTAAFLKNIQSVAFGTIGYVQYNARAAQLENVTVSTQAALFKIAQEAIDDVQKADQERDAAADRRAAIQREEEVISLLKQLNAPRAAAPPWPVTTNCTASGDGNSVQCQSY
jgi:hypothetical protein